MHCTEKEEKHFHKVVDELVQKGRWSEKALVLIFLHPLDNRRIFIIFSRSLFLYRCSGKISFYFATNGGTFSEWCQLFRIFYILELFFIWTGNFKETLNFSTIIRVNDWLDVYCHLTFDRSADASNSRIWCRKLIKIAWVLFFHNWHNIFALWH